MSSDPEKYGRVADGTYNGNYDEAGKSGSLTSNWAINGRGRVAAQDNINPNMPSQVDGEGNAYLTGVFIHRSNKNGYAGSPVSKGCLLIAPGRSGQEEDWVRFNNQMSGVQNFKLEVNRSVPERKPRFR